MALCPGAFLRKKEISAKPRAALAVSRHGQIWAILSLFPELADLPDLA